MLVALNLLFQNLSIKWALGIRNRNMFDTRTKLAIEKKDASTTVPSQYPTIGATFDPP